MRRRALDRDTDGKLWDQVAAIANRKYGSGDRLPVEVVPLSPPPTQRRSSTEL